jgi:hypothetical protein
MLRTLTRRVALLLALSAMAVGDLQAAPFNLPGRGDDKGVCAAERAPILERQRQYQALRRTRIAKAAGEGLKKGAGFFAGAMLSRYGFGGGGGGSGGLPFGLGSAGEKTAAAGPAAGGTGSGFLNGAVLGEAAGLAIPGVTLGSGRGLSNDTKAIAAVAVVVAIVGSVEAYVRLKEEEANGDRYRMARSIEDDAGLQIPVSRAIAQEEAALAACMQRQITDVNAHLASASNSQDRRGGDRERISLIKAIKSDVDLTDDICNQQATLAKTFTQGRAMTEGRSEAEVLGAQTPSYAASAATTRLQMPAPGDAKLQKASTAPEPTAPLPAPVYMANRAAVAHAAPDAKSKVVGKLNKGAVVAVTDAPAGPWATVQTAGGVGYVLRAYLTVRTEKATAASREPTFAPPANVREHNRAVIEARDQGPNRLKSLLTTVQAT